MPAKDMPSKKEIMEQFNYIDGDLFWRPKKTGTNSFEGKLAGCVNSVGYRVIRWNNSLYTAHRLIWGYHNEKVDKNLIIDHINGDKLDNRIENLRQTSQSVNSQNTKTLRKGNSTGYRGVYFDDMTKKKWKVNIKVDGKLRHIGRFETKIEAAKARDEAVKQHYTPPYYLNFP